MYKQKMNKDLKDYLYILVGSILTQDDYRKILDYFNQLKQERDHYKNKTLDNLYMKDFNGEKVFCLEDDKETYRDMIFELQERINKAIEYIEKNSNEELSVDSYFKFKDLCEFDDILDILKGSDKE